MGREAPPGLDLHGRHDGCSALLPKDGPWDQRPAILAPMMTARRYGAQSMTAPLRDVLVKRPGPAFGAAFDVPATASSTRWTCASRSANTTRS